jgi:uncharacterized LabA/DUF88 family protein
MNDTKVKLKIKKDTLLIVDWANVYGWKKSLNWEVCPKKLFHYLDRPKIIDKRLYHGVEKRQTKSEAFKGDMETLGYTVVSKEVKWTPVELDKQNHFKKIIKRLFNVLDNIKQTNSEISVELYDLIKQFDSLKEKINHENEIKKEDIEEIYKLIEDLDTRLKDLNIEIDLLQGDLKKPVYRRKCDFDVEITKDALNMIDDYETLLLFSGDGDYFALTEDLIKKGKKVIIVFAEGHKGKEYDAISNSLFYQYPVENIENLIKK